MRMAFFFWLGALAAAPMLPGVANRVKAAVAGRQGPPVFQLYRDLWKWLAKGAVYSTTTTWLFRFSPLASVAGLAAALALVPWAAGPAWVHFTGDFVLWIYLLVAVRLMTVWAAMDTGSSFEGMGASRELWFAVLAEPAVLLVLAALARHSGSLSLSGMLQPITQAAWGAAFPALILASVAWFVLLLAENSRLPVDDPSTHLELTMVHEVMILDHGGPDLALLEYAASLKWMVFAAMWVRMGVPQTGAPLLDTMIGLAGLGMVPVLVGIVESSMARLQLKHVPHLLIGAAALAAVALILTML